MSETHSYTHPHTHSHAALSGKKAGEAFSAGGWMLGGVFLGLLMPLISHAMKKPEPSAELLAAIPVEERLGFADAYGDAAKSKRNRFAWIGMGISFVSILMLTQCGVCLAGMATM